MDDETRWVLEDFDPEVDDPADTPAGNHEGADIPDPPELSPAAES